MSKSEILFYCFATVMTLILCARSPRKKQTDEEKRPEGISGIDLLTLGFAPWPIYGQVFTGKYPTDYTRIQIMRVEWAKPVEIHTGKIDPMMNTIGLWWKAIV